MEKFMQELSTLGARIKSHFVLRNILISSECVSGLVIMRLQLQSFRDQNSIKRKKIWKCNKVSQFSYHMTRKGLMCNTLKMRLKRLQLCPLAHVWYKHHQYIQLLWLLAPWEAFESKRFTKKRNYTYHNMTRNINIMNLLLRMILYKWVPVG